MGPFKKKLLENFKLDAVKLIVKFMLSNLFFKNWGYEDIKAKM